MNDDATKGATPHVEETDRRGECLGVRPHRWQWADGLATWAQVCPACDARRDGDPAAAKRQQAGSAGA